MRTAIASGPILKRRRLPQAQRKFQQTARFAAVLSERQAFAASAFGLHFFAALSQVNREHLAILAVPVNLQGPGCCSRFANDFNDAAGGYRRSNALVVFPNEGNGWRLDPVPF